MARQIKSSFTAGELAPEMLGRGDLRAYANGARRLRNVFLQPTGGLSRRPGLRHVAVLPGAARLVAFEFNTEQAYLIVLVGGGYRVVLGDAVVASGAAPWTEAMLPHLAFTQSADTLLICHPALAPTRLTRTGHTAWTLTNWSWVNAPLFRFAPAGVSLTPSALSGTVTLTASAPVFDVAMLGGAIRFRGVRGTVALVFNSNAVSVQLAGALPSLDASADWEEAAFSPLRGWPVSVCFHQDRLVIGGSRDLPNRLWMSRSGALFDFDPGAGWTTRHRVRADVGPGERHPRGVLGTSPAGLHHGRRMDGQRRSADALLHPAQPADADRLPGRPRDPAGGRGRLDHLRRPFGTRHPRIRLYGSGAGLSVERPRHGGVAPDPRAGVDGL
jgi:hypothetical protein